jgi:hypothetical protein
MFVRQVSCVLPPRSIGSSLLFQNIAEIDEIPSSEKLKPITLPAAELAIYLELLHHLRALDMTIKRSKKTDGDREKRLQQSLGDSA